VIVQRVTRIDADAFRATVYGPQGPNRPARLRAAAAAGVRCDVLLARRATDIDERHAGALGAP